MKMEMVNGTNFENMNSKLTNGMVIRIWQLLEMIGSDQIEEAE